MKTFEEFTEANATTELDRDELHRVKGAKSDSWGRGYFRCSNPECSEHFRCYDVADEVCHVCWSPMEWVNR